MTDRDSLAEDKIDADIQYEKNEREEFDGDDTVVIVGDGRPAAVRRWWYFISKGYRADHNEVVAVMKKWDHLLDFNRIENLVGFT